MLLPLKQLLLGLLQKYKMKITIPQFLEENQLLKKIDELSYAKYIQCAYQERNELEIVSNVLIFVTKGKKILHLAFGDKTINASDILFLKSGHYVMSEVLDESYGQKSL